MSSSDPNKRKRAVKTSKEQDESVERGKGKRERRDVEEERRTVKLGLEEAKKELKEAEKKRDDAKVERDAAEVKRDKYREAYFSEPDVEHRDAYKQAWEDAEIALHTAQSAIDACQRALNHLVGRHASKRARSGENKVREAPKSVQDFWVQLGDARVEDGRKLQLVGGTRFLGNKILQSELYIRTHYEKIFARIDFLATQKKLTGTAILGTPGIGKTYFLYWLLWKLRLQKAPVVMFETGDRAYRFSADGTVDVTSDVRSYPELERDDCWYLADGVRPVHYCRGITVLATSPDRSKWYQFEQQADAVVLYMPLFTLEEMLECQKACFPSVSEEDVRVRFNKYGGMARAVLQKPATGQPSMMDRYDTAVQELDDDFDVNVLQQVASAIRKKDDVVHRIVHMDVTDFEEYTHFEYRLASRQIEEQIVARYWRGQAERVRRFVRASQGQSSIAQIRGLAFEERAHYVLCQGGKFRVRNLENPTGVTEEEWPQRELVRFQSLEEVPSIVENGGYACPVSKNLAAVDSIVGSDAVQITVSLNHPEKGDKLGELLKVANVERLLFVVPADQFGVFEKQEIKGGKNAESLDQFVLEIPL